MSYDPGFVHGFEVSMPRLNERLLPDAFNDGTPADHTRFSLVFNESRGFAFFTAHNVDGASLLPSGTIPRDDNFRLDPLVTPEIQVNDNRGYRQNPWDRGHLVRRTSLHWGDEDEAREADSQSFFWSNIAPQHHRLHSSAWGRIERWILAEVATEHRRACVFTGPVFTPDDPLVDNQQGEPSFRLPAGFWKVMATRDGDRRIGAGFLVWQRDYASNRPVSFSPVLEQVRITTIEHLTGLSFADLREADPLLFSRADRSIGPRAIPAVPAPRASTRISRPNDLVL